VEEKEVADTVSAIMNISGKSLRSLERICSLLNLPEEIQNALREGAIDVSQVLSATVTPAALLSPRQRYCHPGSATVTPAALLSPRRIPDRGPGQAPGLHQGILDEHTAVFGEQS